MLFKVLSEIRLWTFLVGMSLSFTFGVWWCRYFVPERIINQRLCKIIQTRTRQRIYTEEKKDKLQTKELLFIGIMTSQKFLTTRARGVYETWGKSVPGKLVFFAGSSKTKTLVNFMVIYLPVPDDVHPPQRKSLAMLKYIHDNYIDQFQWFIRADDDVYIRPKKLITFLRSLNSSQLLLLGQAGVGKEHERGKLGLKDGDNFCIGGPGVIMSRRVLKSVNPHLEYCSNHTATFHEDTEVGRCLRNFAGVICPWAFQAREFFHQEYENQAEAYHHDLSTSVVTNAITLHPIKDPAYMRRLHVHYLTAQLQKTNHKIWSLNHRLEDLKKVSTIPRKSATVHRNTELLKAGIEKPTVFPKNASIFRRNVDFFGNAHNWSGAWETFTTRKLYPLFRNAPIQWIHDSTRAGLVRVVRKARKLVDEKSADKKYHVSRLASDMLGYVNSHPTLGLQYILYISTINTIRANEDDKRKQITEEHPLKFQNPFSELMYQPLDTDFGETVHFIVPLVGRLENFRRFLASFENSFLRHDKNVKLLIVYFTKLESPRKHIQLLRMYKKRYPQGVFYWLNVNTDNFQRGLALNKGSEYFGRNVLLFFADVDLVFDAEFLFRCRGNTQRGHQVYFPMMFSTFHPNISNPGGAKDHFNFHKDRGLWRYYSYGPVCVYSDDVNAVGGFNTTIKGWGLEDIEFFERIAKRNMSVHRSPDRGLVHVYHKHTLCSDNLTFRQFSMCNNAIIAYLTSASSAHQHLTRKGYI